MTPAGELPADELDPRLGAVLHERLPGLRAALDGDAMAGQLGAVLGARIEQCLPEQASYLGDSCLVRYAVDVAGRRSIVTGRVFPDTAACSSYVSGRLQPLADAADPRTAPAFASPVGAVPALGLALSVFPLDGELPTLVGATDPAAMLGVFRVAVPRTFGAGLVVTACDIEPGHYGREHRCVLRYRLEVSGPGGGEAAPQLVVYGKVAADDRGERVGEVVTALRSRLGSSVAVPRVLDYLPELRLALFEGLPGAPRVAQLVRARLGGVPPQDRRPPSLDSALASCARTAAMLHASGLEEGRARPFEVESAALRDAFALVAPVAPRLADRLEGWLAAAEEEAAGAAQPLVFSHGDFSYTQLIFDGERAGLVDFDTLCRAEPGLDLGHFLAYLDLAARKAGVPGTGPADHVRGHFLRSYTEARGLTDPDRLLARSTLYETVSLLRLAAHSWAKFKPGRLRLVLAALEDRAVPVPGRRT